MQFVKVAQLPVDRFGSKRGVFVHGYRVGSQVAGYTGLSAKPQGACKPCEIYFAHVYLPAWKTRYLAQFALHEAGHVLGLGHTTYNEVPSVMLPSGGASSIAAIDLRHILELYP